MKSLTPQPDLKALAARINAEHQACELCARDALTHAIECGQLLIEVKASVSHGEWGKWLADHRSELQSKTQRVADLPIREALALLADRADDDILDPIEARDKLLALRAECDRLRHDSSIDPAERSRRIREIGPEIERAASSIEHWRDRLNEDVESLTARTGGAA